MKKTDGETQGSPVRSLTVEFPAVARSTEFKYTLIANS